MKTWLVVFFICTATLLVAHTIGTLHNLRCKLKVKTELESRMVYANITKPLGDILEREHATSDENRPGPGQIMADLIVVERALNTFDMFERLTADAEPSMDTLFNNRTMDVHQNLTQLKERLRNQLQKM